MGGQYKKYCSIRPRPINKDVNCMFMPIKLLERMTDPENNCLPKYTKNHCVKNLADRQIEKTSSSCKNTHSNNLHTHLFQSVRSAIWSHDWDKLLFILQHVPLFEREEAYDFYLKPFLLCLFNHPKATNKEGKSVLMDLFEYFLNCRQENEKRAVMKLLLTIPDAMLLRMGTPRIHEV